MRALARERLAAAHPDKRITFLDKTVCYCSTMNRIDLPHLCWVLENLAQGRIVNQITVDPHTRRWATVAHERMLAIKGTGNPIGKSQPAGTTVD